MRNIKTYIGYILVAVIFFVLYWGYNYYQNASIEKVVKLLDSNKILERVDIGQYTFVIFDTGEVIKGASVEKGMFGWKVINVGEAIKGNLDEPFTQDYFGLTTNGDIALYFGYVNETKVESIRFQSDHFDIKYPVKSYYWFIPSLENATSFKANQFSVILKDGSEVFYPFDEFK
jgi:hypothetical protein